MTQEIQTYKTSLWELYYIINNEMFPHYHLRDFFWDAFNEADDETLIDAGSIREGEILNSITREVAFEHFGIQIINKIIEMHNRFQVDPEIKKMEEAFSKSSQ